jgi:glycosyltransferase involved in cell wall biosynthesis
MIGVLIPAYNAESTVGAAVTGARAHVAWTLVVDDGSSDATGRRARESGAEVLTHAANVGKGAALRTGFTRMMERNVEAVVTMDADLQHDPDDIPRFIEQFRRTGADLIVGSRRHDFFSMKKGRRVGNVFSCGALKFFTGLELPDSQSGFRLHGAEFVRSLALRRRNYDAEMEVLLQAARQRRRVETMPITLRAADGAATSYFRPWVDTYRICRTVVMFSVCAP